MASYEELLEATGKEYLTPTEFRILNERERSGGLEDMFMGSGKAYAGMARDLYKSNIEGDERYDRDWNWSDAMTPAYDAMSLFGFRPAAAAMKSKLAAGAAKGAGKGLQKGYNAATGAKRGASTAPKVTGGKKTLDAPDGKQGQLALPGPKGAATPASKPGMMQKAGTAIKNNPIKSTLAGAAGLGGAAAGINAILPDAPKGLDPLEQPAEEEIVDPAANQNLDNPNGQMAMTPEGQAQAAMQAKANSMPDMVNRLGGSGSKMGNLAKGRVQAQANFMADDIIKAQKIQARKDASKAHREGVMADNWETSQIGRASGKAWDELDDDTRQDMQKRFMANLGSPYDSAQDAKQARLDKVINEFGGNYVSPDGEIGAPGQLTKEQFTEQTGLKNEGTGIVNTTLDGKGPVTTLEMGGQFDKAGGLETAKPFLSDVQQVNLERQLDRPGVFNDQFGQEQEMSKDTVRMTSDEQDYSDANFQNRDDALAYLNRGASLDEPAPETPAAPEAPEEEEGEEGGWDKYAPYLAPLALAHPATRKWGSKMLPKFKKNVKQLEGNFYNATPIPRFSGQAPRLGNSPMQLPNKAPGLPHRAPGLPNRADPNVPAALPNKSMSAPAGRQVTPEQFRKGQTGMGPSERASAVGAKEAQERATTDRIAQMNRKARLEREARARRLAGQPMNSNPYGVPRDQIHMNGQLPATKPTWNTKTRKYEHRTEDGKVIPDEQYRKQMFRDESFNLDNL